MSRQRRCGNCGAEIQARHLGSVKIGDSDVAIGYCERCNAFAGAEPTPRMSKSWTLTAWFAAHNIKAETK